MLFQIFLVVFSVLAMARTIRQYKVRQVSRYWLGLMLIVWTGVALVAILPKWTDIVASAVGVGRGADLLVYIAIIVLLWSHYRLMIRQHVISQELTALVRHQAIAEGKSALVADVADVQKPL